jgi:DNA repair exonuclease SbcCD ATPase subunit
MGLFGLIKKKPEEKIIPFNQIENWLDGYVQNRQVGETITTIKRELHSKIKRMDELLYVLESTALTNSKILPERAINIMDGNRKSYVQKIRNFADRLDFPEKYDDAKDFLEKVSEELDELAKDTQKNYYILKEFMEDQVRPVAGKLSELDKLIASAREQLDKTPLDKVAEIKNHIKTYYLTENQIMELKKGVEEIESFKIILYEKRNKIDDKIKSLKEGKGFDELIKLEKKEESLRAEIKKLEDKATTIFSDIEPALKKYYNKKKDKFIKGYLSDPIKAILEDEELSIVKHAKNMLKEIDGLELKDEKKKKIEKRLEDLELKAIKELKSSLSETQRELSELVKRIKNHSVKLNIKEQEGWLETLDKDIQEEDRKIENLGYELERLNLGLIKQKIRQKLKELDERLELAKNE